MIKYLKAIKHRGIKEIKLENLGTINVICGKNNSGKTSLLEALNNKEYFAIGKKIDSIDYMKSLFEDELKRHNYNEKYLSSQRKWFENFIAEEIEQKRIWYQNEKEQTVKRIRDSMLNDKEIKTFNRSNDPKFDPFFDSFFIKTITNYKPVLIPPKRNTNYIYSISFEKPSDYSGVGIINRLFFFKNQHLSSKEYKIYEKINEAFYNITKCNFNIVPEGKNDIRLYFKRETENDANKWLSGDAWGLGLSDILIMLVYALDYEFNFIFIEEPENHLHPEIQKRFLNFIKNIKSKQFFFSTHSNEFLNPYIADKIFYSEFKNEISVSDNTSKAKILSNIGYSISENFSADLIILTEGPSDKPIFMKIFNWMSFEDQYNIKFWPLGGDNMVRLDLSLFSESSKVFVILDSDTGSKVNRTRFQRMCKKNQIKCYKLKRYSIENYFTIETLRKVFPGKIPGKITQLNPKENVDKQIGFKAKGKSIKSKNEEIIGKMSFNDIKNTDLYSICNEIKNNLIVND